LSLIVGALAAQFTPTTKRGPAVGNSGNRGTQEPARKPHRRSILPARRPAPKSPKCQASASILDG